MTYHEKLPLMVAERETLLFGVCEGSYSGNIFWEPIKGRKGKNAIFVIVYSVVNKIISREC